MKTFIETAARQISGNVPDFHLFYNTDLRHADVSTDIAFKLAQATGKKPVEIAELLAEKLRRQQNSDIKEICTKNGYINFFFSDSYLGKIAAQICEHGTSYGSSPRRNTRVNIEFCSANPTGPLHIAHGRAAVVGDIIASVLQKAGYDVTREYYVNDSGNQIEQFAKTIYARYRQIHGASVSDEEILYKGDYVKELAEELYKRVGDSYFNSPDFGYIKQLGVEAMLAGIQKTLNNLGVAHDTYSSQKELESKGEDHKVIELLKQKNYTFEKDGALWARSTDYGDSQDRVIVKQDGTFPYRVTDYAYHIDKFRRGYDKLIVLLGPDHHSHIQDMSCFLKMLGHKPDQFKAIIIQHCKVMSGGVEVKMSKRQATFITLNELLERVPRDSVRFFFAMRKAETHLDFDLDLAVKTTPENPAFYVQYAYARICSIFKKACTEPGAAPPPDISMLSEREKNLLRLLARFPHSIEAAARELDPSIVTLYTTELARAFQSYYQMADKDKSLAVLCSDGALRAARLGLLRAVRTVLQSCFEVLGISAPEQM